MAAMGNWQSYNTFTDNFYSTTIDFKTLRSCAIYLNSFVFSLYIIM